MLSKFYEQLRAQLLIIIGAKYERRMGLLSLRLLLFVLVLSNIALVHGQDDEEAVEEGEIFSFQESSENWTILKSSNGIKFTPRNAHATCVFRDASGLDKIWVTGGKTDLYKMYNTLFSYRKADVWWSLDGADWVQEAEQKGDFYAQNADALPNWEMAPWYTRFGHTLSPVDTDGDGVDDVMMQLGGFAPQPQNDVWITEDGITWAYAGFAAWSPRGWHSATKFNGKLYVMGGSPLNNEVWVLDSVTTILNRKEPITRSNFLTYTYETAWTNLGDADWSPRAGMNIFSQWYYRPELNETIANTTERMVFTGGFGGYIEGTNEYDGYRSRADVWDTYDGITWTLLTEEGFPPRAWHVTQVMHSASDITLDYADNAAASPYFKPPRMVMVGGGYIGGATFNTKIATAVIGLADLWFSWDGITWRRVNYEQGNGVRQYDTFVQYFSSQEWSITVVDSKVNYLGMWGSTSVFLNNQFIIIGGDKTGAGPLQSETYLALNGVICDIEGNICNGHGVCRDGTAGCLCTDGCKGIYCDDCPEELEAV